MIATTGEVSKSINPMRMPYAPNEIGTIAHIDGRISILFGRENWGLNNEDQKSDIVCHPSARYPSSTSHMRSRSSAMNWPISHGVMPFLPREEMECPVRPYRFVLTLIHHPDFKRSSPCS